MLKEQEHIYLLEPDDTASDIPFGFRTPQGTSSVTITLDFAPDREQDAAVCRKPILDALRLYDPQVPESFLEEHWQDYLPVKNLITISLEHEGSYLGNAHRWDCQQSHFFTALQTARGFCKPQSLCGEWKGMLHIHEVISPKCRAVLKIIWEVCDELDTI